MVGLLLWAFGLRGRVEIVGCQAHFLRFGEDCQLDKFFKRQ